MKYLLLLLYTLLEAIEPVTWYTPDINTTWQWQLSGSPNITYEAEVYDLDLFDTDQSVIDTLHRQGKKVICYFSAGTFEAWREDAALFSERILGKRLEAWSDEQWVNIRSAQLRSIIQQRLDLAKLKQCDGVEADNVDGYLHETGFSLSKADQLHFNLFLAQEAHERSLSIGLKNDLEQIDKLHPFFDFAINEQCHEYNECEALMPFIQSNKPVFNAEYSLDCVHNINFRQDQVCAKSRQNSFQTLILPLELDDSFRINCP